MAEVPVRGGPTQTGAANASSTLYTKAAGAGTWAILRSVNIVNETGGDVRVTVGVGTTNADAAGKRIIRNLPVQMNVPEGQDFFVPLAPGDLVYAVCDTDNGATVTLGLVEGP